jgi:hypothetical protein
LAASLIVAAITAAFANSFRGAFVFDDTLAIENNQTIRHLWPIGPVLSPPLLGATVAGRPLLNLSFAINYALGGRNPWGYHAVNLSIHILAALLLFGILRRTFRLPRLRNRFGPAATPLALVITLLWALHPLQTESITYIAQRAESGCGLLYLLVLYCALRGATGKGEGETSRGDLPCSPSHSLPISPSAFLWYSAAILACLLGTAFKEVIVSAPLFVLLYDRTLLSGSFRQAVRQRWALYLGLLATEGLLAYIVKTMSLPASFLKEGVNACTYCRTQPEVIFHYLRLCFWPWPLCVDYCWPVATTLGQVLPGLIVLGLLAAATLYGLLRRTTWSLLGAWFFLILAPTSSILPLYQLATEHRLYLPLTAVLTALDLRNAEPSRAAGAPGGNRCPRLSGRDGDGRIGNPHDTAQRGLPQCGANMAGYGRQVAVEPRRALRAGRGSDHGRHDRRGNRAFGKGHCAVSAIRQGPR